VGKRRLDPDVLLKKANAEERKKKQGRLKIYLGAAPGVGKTYTMLQDAKLKREQGLDVVIGVVESHGRTAIEKLIEGLEQIPQQKISYKGRNLEEFDIDFALKRNPGLILIDEMAHSNVKGLRHSKRWQDIKELLDRGVDVYTTLNVQHIESLNDDVAGIIHAPINETVPDSMLEMAETIELVDLPPEELLTRLHEGKVYFPSQAVLAKDNFFRKGNLIALRELALRVTAARVGAQVLLYRQGEGIKHIWSSSEKILVCVGPGPESLKLIRAARRLANTLQAKWSAIYVDSSRTRITEAEKNSAIKNLQVAESLGAQTQVLSGFDIVKEVMSFAREQNISLIMVWKNIRSRWFDFWKTRLADEIVRSSYEINVYIMTGKFGEVKSRPRYEMARQTKMRKIYFTSIISVIAATFFNYFVENYVTHKNLILVYLIAVTIVSLYGRFAPAILTMVLSILAYVWFFFPGILFFKISSVEYIGSIIVLMMLASLICYLAVITRKQALAARFAEKQSRDLHSLSRKLASTRGTEELLNVGIQQIAEIFDTDIMALLSGESGLEVRSIIGETTILDDKEIGVAQWVYELGQNAGIGTDTLPMSEALYLPLTASEGTIGVLRVRARNSDEILSPEKMDFLETCSNQLALALEVDLLQEESKQTEFAEQLEQARQIVLRSVTHDLRAPLASIMLSASTQMQTAKNMNVDDIKRIGEAIYTDTEQLNTLINNLLQINYLETNRLNVNMHSGSLKALVTDVLQKSREKLGKRPVHIRIPSDVPDFPFDRKLMAEVLINLLDNAYKYGPSDKPIEIIAENTGSEIIVSVGDHGPGIADADIGKIFEKFYRGHNFSQSTRGLGLGLAICRVLIESQGGKIWAENRVDGGAVLKFSMSLASASSS